MSELVNRIEKTLKEKNLTFNRVERDCGLGNGTIKRWSGQSPRLDKLVAVSEYLNVSLDYLVFGSLRSENEPNGEEASLELEGYKAEQGLTCDGSPLSDIEADLVAMFRLLSENQQEELFDLIYFKYKRHVEQKKESIYSTYFAENEQPKSGSDDEQKARHETA